MTRRVVFWDFDGTLARREGLFAGALVDAWRRIDEPIADAAALRTFLQTGFPWHTPEAVIEPLTPEEWWSRMSRVFIDAYVGAGAPAEVAVEAAALVPEEFYRLGAWEVIDGAREALALTADAGYRNVILSNHGPELPQLVDGLGFVPWVELTITSAAVGVEKPHARIFELARERTGAASDSWMVGDNPIADVEGARAAGMRAILADGIYPDARGVTVLEAARVIIGSEPRRPQLRRTRPRDGR